MTEGQFCSHGPPDLHPFCVSVLGLQGRSLGLEKTCHPPSPGGGGPRSSVGELVSLSLPSPCLLEGSPKTTPGSG